MTALGKGNAAEAVEAMRHHICTSRDAMLRRLEPYFLLGDTSGQAYARSRKNKFNLGALIS